MFAMSHHTYAYPAQPPQPQPARQYSGHGTSSAFSSSANPDEDWTKISDLAERRRIQNRIAQRNYRKKLKRRLEELERRAGTSDGGASSSGNEKPSPSASSKNNKRPQQQQSQATKVQKQQTPTPPQKPVVNRNQFTPPMHHDDEYLFPTSYDERERSHTPPMFSYSAYPPPPEDMLMPYGTAPSPYTTNARLPHPHVHHQYQPATTTAAETYSEYVTATTVPVTLPSMTHFSDALKREPGFNAPLEEVPAYMSYNNYLPASPYDHMPHTPPLSHSFDHSGNCSDSGSYEYPTTPLSMPGSPGMVAQHV